MGPSVSDGTNPSGLSSDSAPPAGAGRRRRRRTGRDAWTVWLTPIAIVVVVGLVMVTLLTRMPVVHHVQESFAIPGRSGFSCGVGPNITSPRDGDLRFSWVTNPNGSGSLYVNAVPPGPGQVATVYSSQGTNGSGDIYVYADYAYIFEYCAGASDIVQVSGTLSYEAPWF